MPPPDFTQPHPPRLAAKAKRRRATISLTPLIDVVFILLVFFMLASSFLDWRSIDLDPPAKAGTGGGLKGAMLIEIQRDGLRLAGRDMSLEALQRKLTTRLAEDPTQRVLVKAGGDVRLQRTVSVLDVLAGTGVSNLSLIGSDPLSE